jgi:flagellar assembly protein FliH
MSVDTPAAEDAAEDVKLTRLVRAQDVATPQVHTWQLMDLAQEEKQRELKIRSEVYEQIQRELQPQITRQTAILKREAYEEAKQAGYEDGYQAGFETGQAQGLEKAERVAAEALKPQVERLEQVFDALAQPHALIEQAVFDQLAQMALMLAERLVEHALAVDSQKMIAFVKQAVALLPDEKAQIEVELNPQDFELVQFYQTQHKTGWQLVAREQIAPGTCRVKCLNSVVNHNWKQRLTTLLSDSDDLIASLVNRHALSADDASLPPLSSTSET